MYVHVTAHVHVVTLARRIKETNPHTTYAQEQDTTLEIWWVHKHVHVLWHLEQASIVHTCTCIPYIYMYMYIYTFSVHMSMYMYMYM